MLKFDAHIQYPAEGLSRGIVVMWKEDLLKMDNIISQKGIHVRIKVCPKSYTWIFSTIYASPDLEKRKTLWDKLKPLKLSHPMDWLLGGDFNEVLYAEEKLGVNNINNSQIKAFWSCIQSCNLIVLGYQGKR